MPSQHHAIGLQTGCMVIVLARVVEAARLPRVCPMALGYGLPPNNIADWDFPQIMIGIKRKHPLQGLNLRPPP